MTAGPYAPRKSPGQERSRRTVERILDAAARIFDEAGYASTNTNDIADEAGVSVGSLYQYFPNKDALLVALARRHVRDTSVVLDQLLDEVADDELRTAIRTVIRAVVAQHELDHLHLLIAHRAPRTAELQEELDGFRHRMVEATARLLEPSVTDGNRRELAAGMVVAVIDAAVHEVILARPAGPGRERALEFTVSCVEAVIEQSARLPPSDGSGPSAATPSEDRPVSRAADRPRSRRSPARAGRA